MELKLRALFGDAKKYSVARLLKSPQMCIVTTNGYISVNVHNWWISKMVLVVLPFNPCFQVFDAFICY